MAIIGVSLSSSGMKSSDITFTAPGAANSTISLTIGGLSRSFDILYTAGINTAAGREYDVYYLWIEIFMM